MTEEPPWEGQCSEAAYTFGLQCARLVKSNPYKESAPLNRLIRNFMTELWDRNFSQAEIRAAFEAAVNQMPHYAAGEDRRSATTTLPFTTEH